MYLFLSYSEILSANANAFIGWSLVVVYTVSDSAVWISRESIFYHLHARRDKSLDVCLPCTLRNHGTRQTVLEDQRWCGVVHWAGAGLLAWKASINVLDLM